MTTSSRHGKRKEDPFEQYVTYYLAVRQWHAYYEGPRFERREVPYHDWTTNTERIGHEYDLEEPEWLSLDLVVEPYRRPLIVSKREITTLKFTVTSSSSSSGGLFECRGGDLPRGWVFWPFAGVQTLLTLLADGCHIVLQINGSAFRRGKALVRSTSGWTTMGHPDLEAEFE